MHAYSTKPLGIIPKIIYVISMISLIFIIFIQILFYMGYAWIDKYERIVFIYLNGVWGLFFPALCFVCSFLIFISGFLIVWKVQTNPVLKEEYGGCLGVFLKLKFSRFMFAASINMTFWGFLAINSCLQFLIAKDYLTNEFFMLGFSIYSIGIIITISILIFGFFDWKKFKEMFLICCGCCCKKRIENTE